jgi:hypothetical protein
MRQNAWFDEWFARSRAEAEKAARRERFRAKWFPSYEDPALRASVWAWRARVQFSVLALVLLALVVFMDLTGANETRVGAVVAFLAMVGFVWCFWNAGSPYSSWDDDSAGG